MSPEEQEKRYILIKYDKTQGCMALGFSFMKN